MQLHNLGFADWIFNCSLLASHYDPTYEFDPDTEQWVDLYQFGLSPRDAVARQFGTLH